MFHEINPIFSIEKLSQNFSRLKGSCFGRVLGILKQCYSLRQCEFQCFSLKLEKVHFSAFSSIEKQHYFHLKIW